MKAEIASYLSYWTLANGIAGLVLTGVIVMKHKRIHLPCLLLSGFVFLVSYFSLILFLYFSELMKKVPFLIGSWAVLTFMLGPIAYLYVKSLMNPKFKLTFGDTVHFLPFATAFFVHMRFWSLPAEEKIALTFQFDRPIEQFGLGCGYSFVFGYYIVMIYLEWRKYHRCVKDNFSDLSKFRLKWVLVFAGILTVLLFSFLFPAFTASRFVVGVSVAISYPLVIVALWAFALYHHSLFEVAKHHGVDTQLVLNEHGDVEPSFTDSSHSDAPVKYKNSLIDQTRMERMSKKVVDHIENKKLYMNNNLKLQDLAKSVGMRDYILSQVINVGLRQNFYDLINKYRINLAKEYLLNPQYQGYTILSIAEEVGFNSKSVFNACFKKEVGMTPSEYRRQNMQPETEWAREKH